MTRRSITLTSAMNHHGHEESPVTDVPDMNDLLRQAMAMQEQLLAAQQEAAERTVTGRAGGGLVKVTLTGGGEPSAVEIAPEAIDPAEPELLEDLVLAALRDAVHQVQQLQASAMGGFDLGALGLDGLGGIGDPGDPGATGPGAIGPGSGPGSGSG
jgi:nucleoid-associated protein EbfC